MVVNVRTALICTGLALLSLTLTLLIFDEIAVRTGVLGGISVTEFLTDEFRIRFMSPPPPAPPGIECWHNETHLLPNCQWDFCGYHTRLPCSRIKTNSFGIRDKEYSLEKPTGTYRIFVVGDSYTFGWGVDNEDIYTEVLEERLNGNGGGKYEVFNLGINGIGTDLKYLRLLQYSDYSPDLVILHVVQNDIYECGEVGEGLRAVLAERNLSPGRFDEYSATYLDTLDQDKACSCILRYLGLIRDECNKRRIPLILHGHFDDSLLMVYRTTPVSGGPPKACNLSLLDGLEAHFVRDPPLERKHIISRVDHHPNREGHAKIADSLYPGVLAVIENEHGLSTTGNSSDG